MKRIKFLKPVLNFYLIGLLILNISRLVLALAFKERVLETDQFWLMFPIGLRFDIIMLSYLAVLPTMLIVLLPFSILNKIKGFIRYFFVVCIGFLLFMELATP
ncbi:MAG: LTA synthase family protein, partial [Xanthomarina sp.]